MNKTESKLMTIISLEIPKELYEPLKTIGAEVLKEHEVSGSIIDHPERSHISLYVGMFPEHNKDEVLRIVKEITSKTSSIQIKPRKLNEKSRFVAIEFENVDELQELHESLMRKLNPLREGLLKDKYSKQETLAKLTAEEKENMHKWGYPHGMNCFSPHLTLGRFEDQKQAVDVIQQTPKLSPLESISFRTVEVVFVSNTSGGKRREKFIYSLK